jgi:hypothetical protein
MAGVSNMYTFISVFVKTYFYLFYVTNLKNQLYEEISSQNCQDDEKKYSYLL